MDVKCLIVLFGSTGRIGKALLNFLAPEHSVSCLHFVPGTLAALLLPAERIVFVLAVPSSVAEQIVLEIEKTGKNVMIVDCSGFVKVSRPHLHAFDVLDSSFATKSTKMMIGNAGCVASAVIETVKQLPVLGPISVVATGVCVFFFACCVVMLTTT